MKNRVLYLSLNFISVLFLLYTFIKTSQKNRRFLLPLFLAFTGINYVFEFFVLVVTKAYAYRPKLYKNRYFDNVFGSTVSQLFVVPTTSLFISVFNKSIWWKLLVALFLSTVERIFVKNKIFKHYWWKTTFTFIGLLTFFNIATYWRKLLIEKELKVIEILTTFFAIFVCSVTLNFYHVSLLKTCMFNVKIFSDRYRSHVFLSTIYSVLNAILFTINIYLKSWRLTALTAFSFFSIEFFFNKLKVIKITSMLFYPSTFLTKFFSLWIGKYVHGLLHQEQKPEANS
ncbi:hypothetical protein [Litchfieldia alkalitelluris]|uniref:hypothetical protein n=1 Tax=Litchfieldia alkalitelluris TaxID=304268 RepID=UPI000B43605F|nr:hypothetical protein [Litchfieldia alkalitelluris]